MNKDIQKSVRMTQEVYSYVDAQVGNGFNAKFENMVLRCMTEAAQVEEQIRLQQKELNRIKEECADRKKVLEKIKAIERYVDYAIRLGL